MNTITTVRHIRALYEGENDWFREFVGELRIGHIALLRLLFSHQAMQTF